MAPPALEPPAPLGVTLIGGFLGAGKTTLLSRLVQGAGAARLGVLVNDFGDLAVDAAAIRSIGRDVMRLENGCICCSLSGELMQALIALKDGGEVDHVVIETSGVSDTEALVRDLFELERGGVLRLDLVLTLVDAELFPRTLAEHGALGRAQVRAADVVVLNKLDLVDGVAADAVEAELRALAPRARVVRTTQAELPLDVVLARDTRPEGWATARAQAAHDGGYDDPGHAHTHELAHAAFSWWTFRYPGRLCWRVLGPVLATLPPGIIRAKGHLELEERPGARVHVHVVGARLHVRTVPLEGTEAGGCALVFIGTQAAALAPELEVRLRACAPV
jgi:G3E family GTPase